MRRFPFAYIPLCVAILMIAFCLQAVSADAPPYELLFADTLSETEGIALCPDGKLYVSGSKTGAVYRILSDEKFETYVDGLNEPAGLACGPDNALYILVYDKGTVVRVKEIKTKKGMEKEVKVIASGLKSPNGAVVGPGGELYVSESEPGRVTVIGANGKVEKFADGVQFANGLALDAASPTLYVASTTGGKIVAIPLAGPDAGKKITFKRGAQMVDGIFLDKSGTIYACLYATGQIMRINPDGTSSIIAKGLKSPASPMVFNGSLYVTSFQGGKGLYRIPISEKGK